MDNFVFELKDVYFSYLGKFPALCGINMNIRRGEKIAVIGANGSGKSTLLQLLDGLIFPDKGIVSFFGKELKEENFSDEDFSRRFRSRVGFVFQNPEVQLFCPTVKEDIVFGPLQLGVAQEEIERRLDDLAEFLKIKSLLERSPHRLSVGEKRKVAIASTLIIDPEVLILDEPTAGLDPLTSRQIIDIIMHSHENGKTVITATHDLHIVEEIADCVCVLSQERKVAKCAATSELLSDTELLKENNLIHIHSHRHKEKLHIHSHEHLDHHP